MNEKDKLIRDWSELNGFDKILNIEGLPLWWFYRRYFTAFLMPSPINTFKQMDGGASLNTGQKTKFSLSAKLLTKYLDFNERRKLNFFKAKKEFSSEEKILFLTYSNHINGEEIFRVQKMIDKVKSDGNYKELILFADPISSSGYKKLVGKENFYQYYEDDFSVQARFDSKLWSSQWKMIDDDIKRKIFTLGEKSLWAYLKYPFTFFFSETFFYYLSLYYRMSKRIIDNEKIKAIVVTSQSGLFEKCLLGAAFKSSIPVFQVQHGIDAGSWDQTYKTKRFVFSDFHKEELVNAGVDEEDIMVTGPIIFDEIFHYIGSEKNSEKTIMLATAPIIEGNRLSKKDYFSKITELINLLKDYPIIIKLHPAEKYMDKYKSLIKESGRTNISVIKDMPRKEFYSLMSNCYLFINFGSTASFEAIILNKPVITIDIAKIMSNELINNIPAYKILYQNKVMVNLAQVSDLSKVKIDHLGSDESMNQSRLDFIKKYCSVLDGKASERAVNFIYGCMK